jgi:hypothetical protein
MGNMVQLQLFKDRQVPQTAPSTAPSVETVRARLEATLNELRGADKLPWSRADLRHWTLVFPQMASWLPPEESDAVKRAFGAELTRLGAKAT